MVTLVVPVYNMERHLPRCINSILAQSDKSFEVLLVDDGSEDSSGSMCDHYAAAYPDTVRVIHKQNGGLASARNAGIDAARGEYIIFPDPDDWVEPNYVASFLEYQERYQADLVCLGHYVDTDFSSVYGNPDREVALMTGKEGKHALLLDQRMQGFCWNKLYRMDLIRRYRLYFSSEMGNTEDLAFTYFYLSHCETVCHVPTRRVYHYYQHPGSATRQKFKKELMGTFRIFEQIMEDFGDDDPQLVQIAADEICTTAVNLIWCYELSTMTDEQSLNCLRGYIRKFLPGYLISRNYGLGRKVQAIVALISPKLYGYLKNLMMKKRTKHYGNTFSY